MMPFEPGDIVDVPFPFIDSALTKTRPALVLSTPEFQRTTGACLLVMITSAERSRWDNDLDLVTWAQAGLRKPSIVRWKLFTLDETLLSKRRGALGLEDRVQVGTALRSIFDRWGI